MKSAISIAPRTCLRMVETLVTEQGVHGDTVLDDECCDWYERKDQHVEYEEFLSCLGCWIDLVTSNRPSCVLQSLNSG